MATKKKKRPVSATFAVVMGDIVGSQSSESKTALSRVFNSAVAAANKKFRSVLVSPLTITLGDEFQGLAKNTSLGFDIVTDLRLSLLCNNVSCRFVLGTTKLDTKVNPAKAWNMMGEGLAQARKRLNDKSDANAYRFSIGGDLARQRLLDAIGLSLTTVEQRWTPTQLEYVQLRRKVDAVIRISSRLHIKPRSVYKVLEAAEWKYYTGQRDAILFALSTLDEGFGMS
jgi:hypothetical protein